MGFDGKKPVPWTREPLAFYRIFLGHDDIIAVEKFNILLSITKVVGKAVFHDIETQFAELSEEPLRIGSRYRGTPLSRARSYTCCNNGLPAMSKRALPGRRIEA